MRKIVVATYAECCIRAGERYAGEVEYIVFDSHGYALPTRRDANGRLEVGEADDDGDNVFRAATDDETASAEFAALDDNGRNRDVDVAAYNSLAELQRAIADLKRTARGAYKWELIHSLEEVLAAPHAFEIDA